MDVGGEGGDDDAASLTYKVSASSAGPTLDSEGLLRRSALVESPQSTQQAAETPARARWDRTVGPPSTWVLVQLVAGHQHRAHLGAEQDAAGVGIEREADSARTRRARP